MNHMSLSKTLLFILLLVGAGVHASTREEIERLYNLHGMGARFAQPQQKPPAPTVASVPVPAAR